MAEKLADWQSKVSAGGSIGQAPFSEAQNFYKPGSPQYETLVELYQQAQDHGMSGYGPAHIAGTVLGAAGGAIGGFGGMLAGELGGYALKPTFTKIMKGRANNALIKAYQAAYPSLTGVRPSGGVPAKQISDQAGEQIKNLIMGMTVS